MLRQTSSPESWKPSGELEQLVEHTLLELTRSLRWIELSLDNGAPAATVLTILHEATSSVQAVLRCAKAGQSSLAVEMLSQDLVQLEQLRTQTGKPDFGNATTACLVRVQAAVVQLLQPCSPSTETRSGGAPLDAPSTAPKCVNGFKFNAARAVEPDEADTYDSCHSEPESDESDTSSDEEVVRMNRVSRDDGRPVWHDAHQRQLMSAMADGRHVQRSQLCMYGSGESEPEGSDAESVELEVSHRPVSELREWRALGSTTAKNHTHKHTMLRVPALALHGMNNDSDSSPRSTPSAPNSARLIISPRSAFEFTNSISHRSSNTESDC